MATTDDEVKFEAYLERLRQEAIRLACYVRVYRKLHADALFSAIVLWVDKLCDERSERGLHNFLAFAEHHRGLFTRRPIDFQIQKDREALRAFGPLESVRLRRDKFHAHFDKDYFLDRTRLAEDAPLRWVDLEETLTLVANVLNRYSAAYSGNRLVLEPLNAGDLDDLLSELHRATGAT